MPAFPITVTFPVHWGEMDALGHVNNTRFFVWFESARVELLTRVDLMADRKRGFGPILASTTCDFARPVVHPATVVTGVRVATVGRTSITMDYAVWREDAPGEPCARGRSVLVLVDYATMQKVEVTPELRARLEAFGGAGD
jgi:acyl-CoA thioester hydrolase